VAADLQVSRTSAAYASCKKESIADILLRASVLSGNRTVPASASYLPVFSEKIVAALERANALAGDGRKTRYERLRAAVVNGLAPASVLSVKQPKGKRRTVHNQAEDPVLPEALKKRIEGWTSR
jgi:hypothetical protein